MMNPEIKEKWIGALTSGEYSQTRQRLKDENGFCCLGVLCDLYIKETSKGEWVDQQGVQVFKSTEKNDRGQYEVESSFLPVVVKQWAGLYTPGVLLPDLSAGLVSHLMIANDGRPEEDCESEELPVEPKPFSVIAEMIKDSPL